MFSLLSFSPIIKQFDLNPIESIGVAESNEPGFTAGF